MKEHISLNQCRRLKEIGYPQEIFCSDEYYWVKRGKNGKRVVEVRQDAFHSRPKSGEIVRIPDIDNLIFLCSDEEEEKFFRLVRTYGEWKASDGFGTVLGKSVFDVMVKLYIAQRSERSHYWRGKQYD